MNQGASVTWDETKAVCAQLIAAAQPYSEELVEQLTPENGVYVLVYAGKQLGGSLWGEPESRIVYLGHCGADSPRHWRNDTGVSTVRRSLAAMLNGDLHLQAVPRSADPADVDRFANYRLDEASELLLTQWMKENLAIAPLPCTGESIEDWYHAILEYANPMFVFTNNPNNSYGPQIKLYRAQMAEAAALYGR